MSHFARDLRCYAEGHYLRRFWGGVQKPALISLLFMRIAQVAPLYESVPPQCYGGTERVVSYLTEELVQLGHDVTLFASGDSETSAELIPMCPQALRLDAACVDGLAHHISMLEQVIQAASQFDMIHFHIDYLHFPLSRLQGWSHVTTLHGRLDLPDLDPLYQEFTDMPVISISDAQRRPIPQADWQSTVHHGLPPHLYSFVSNPEGYLAFIGRISPEKRVDRAIKIAERVGMPLKIAAKVDGQDREYFEESIAPLLESSNVEFLGEIGEDEKGEFLGNARALLFPIDWPEPFGLVLIEAMSCGTPVVAYRHGSVPELVEEGETGYIVEEFDEAVEAVQDIDGISRRRCREVFEDRFTARKMAKNYLEVYERIQFRSPVSMLD